MVFLCSSEESGCTMDLLILNNAKSDGKRPEITRLPQSSGILHCSHILLSFVNPCWFSSAEKEALS